LNLDYQVLKLTKLPKLIELIMSSEKFHYHSTNYKRQFNNDVFYNEIIQTVVHKLGRKLSKNEQSTVVRGIQRMDPDMFKPEYIKNTKQVMVDMLVKKFNTYDGSKARYDDTQEVLRQTIGITSESSTVHGVYDDPDYVLQRYEPNEREIATQMLNAQEQLAPQPQPPTQPPAQQQSANQSEQLDQLKQLNSLMSQMLTRTPEPNAIGNMLGLSTASEAVRILNPNSMLRRNYMILDSRYRITSENQFGPITRFTWSYILNSQAQGEGSVNVVGNVRDIVAMRVFPFRIPYVDNADNTYKRISVLVEDLQSQAFIAHEFRKFHFFLESEIDGAFINLLTNKYNDGYFHFEKPITDLRDLNISFGSPLEPITFDNDRDKCSIDYFGIAPLTQITTFTPHNLANGDRVYFSEFDINPINPALAQQTIINDTIKNTINRKEGFLITVIDASNFSIPYDTSAISNPINGLEVSVYYGSKRLFIPIELTYIMPERTEF
jgi:hypothetical protein